MENKSIKKNFLYNLVLRIMNVIFPLVTFPYVARVLSPEGIGRVDFTLAFIQYFILIAQVGIPMYGIKECSKYRDNKELLSKKVQEILIINFTMMVFSYIILLFFMSTQNYLYNYRTLIFISSLNIFGASIGIEWFFQSIEEYRYITIRSILVKIISIICIFLFVKNTEDVFLYLIITVLSSFLSYIYNFVYANKHINLFRIYEEYDIKSHIKPILTLFMMSIAVSIYINLDKVMLGVLVGDRYVGLYSAANKMIRVVLSVVTALGTVLLPRISYYIEHGKNEKINNIITKSLNFILMITIPAVIGIIILAKPIIILFAGEQYLQAVKTIQILSALIPIIGLSNLVGIQILLSYNLERITLIATMTGATINIILNYILIPKYFHNGAATSSIIAELIVTIIVLLGGLKFIKGNIRLNNIFEYITGAGIILIEGIILQKMINESAIQLFSIVFIGMFSYIMYLYLMKNEMIIEFVNYVRINHKKNRLKK